MSRASAPRAVVFDLDGTLLDSLPLVLAAISHAIEPFGSRPTMDIFAHLGVTPPPCPRLYGAWSLFTARMSN